jgi:DNA gyrase/topoisomerase IV subunit A
MPKIGPAVAFLGVAEDDLLIVTVSGKVIRIQTKQIRPSGRATQGFRLLNLERGGQDLLRGQDQRKLVLCLANNLSFSTGNQE